MQRDLLDLVYPIGRGFIDFTDNDYSNYLGFTWERELMGMFPLGADDANYKVGDMGGNKQHTLTIEEMPSHTHEQEPHYHTANVSGEWNAGATARLKFEESNTVRSTSVNSTTATNKKTGGDKPFSIMPPYKAIYYWKRVS